MSKHEKFVINVEKIPYLNAILLVISFVIFTGSFFESGIIFRGIFIIIDAIVLLLSVFITFSTHYRKLFIAYPQKIADLEDDKRIEIFPYIMESKRVKTFYLSKIKLKESHNYEIVDVFYLARKLNLVQPSQGKSEQEKVYVVNEVCDNDAKFFVQIQNNTTQVNSRFLEFTIYYGNEKETKFFNFIETHRID